MNSKLKLTILMMMAHLMAVCQYPLIKKIGNDSVVIMKVSQAEDINKRFLAMRDTIDGMKADMDNLNKGMDALINKHNTYILKTNDSIYNLRKEMVLLGGQADWYRKEYFSMQYNTYSRLRQINIDNKILIGITATLTAIIALLK